MRRILILAVFASFTFMTGKALDFKKGFVITLNNDTIYGEIANTNYYEHSIKCTFKDYKKNETITYLPNQLVGYRFLEGKYYVSRKIMVDSVPTTLFLEYLINGKLKIYFRQGKGLINHYYAENDSSGIRELIYINEIIHKDDGLYNIEKKKYVGLLDVLTSDCKTLKSDIDKINEPDHGKLIKLAKEYHNLTCPDNTCLIYEKSMPVKIKIEAHALSDILVFTGKSPFPACGINVLFSNAKISERIYVGLGVLYNPVFNTIGNPADEILTSPIRIPLTFYYINPKNGFSPIYSLALDLNTFGSFQTYNAGVKYQINKLSFNLMAQLYTSLFILPYNAGLKFGLMYDL
jgi:hypothetical protein